MGLSSDLVYQFSKVVNGKPMTSDTVLRGTIVKYDEALYVQLDGSNEITPVARTVELNEGDRVEVSIANHSATVTGNLSNPSIGVVTEGNLRSEISRTAAEIRLEVSDLEKDLSSSITQTATEIRSEVSTSVANLNFNMVAIEGSIRKDLGDDILDLNASLADMDNSLRDALKDSVSDLNDAIAGVDTAIRKDFDTDISNMNTRVDTLRLDVDDLDSKITQTAAEIRSEVSAEVSNLNSSMTDMESGIRNDLTAATAELDSKITQTATAIRSEVSASVSDINSTIINTETGIRNDLDIKTAELDSKITQTATSIKSEVSADITNVNGRITELNTKVIQNATSITSLVEADNEFSKFQQTVEGFEFMGKGGTVKIDGGNLNLTGCISFTDLTQSFKDDIDEIETTADKALTDAAAAQGTADSALDAANAAQSTADSAASSASSARSTARSIANGSYLSGTFINGTTIQSPTIEGNEIKVYGTFQTLDYNGDATGYMGAAMGKDSAGNDTYGVAISNKWNYSDFTVEDDDTDIANSYVIVTNAGVRLQWGENSVVVAAGGIYLNALAPGAKAYYNDGSGNVEIGSGSGGDVTVTPVWG